MNTKDEILEKIAQHMMLNSSFADTAGLLDGKMGCVIFFFHFAKYSGKSIYEKFAYELLDEIYEEISYKTPVGFKDGISGIAWGMDYLISNKFVNADDEDLLDEIDKLIVKTGVNEIQDTSVESGLKGLAHYVISRKSNTEISHSMISKDYVRDLINALFQVYQNEETILLIKQLHLIIEETRTQYEHDHLFKKIVSNVVFDQDQIFCPKRSIGIVNNGYTGIGLHYIME